LSDDGKTVAAALGDDHGRYAFRTIGFPLRAKGKRTVIARTINSIGATQPTELIQNPAGYHHNIIIQSMTLTVV
jgi:sulfite dehydrogenase (cytochrome) subunit A